MAAPVITKPAHILLDGLYVLNLFLGWIGIVKTEVACAVKLPGKTEVQHNGLGMSYVEVAVWLRGETGYHPAVIFIGLYVLDDYIPDKI